MHEALGVRGIRLLEDPMPGVEHCIGLPVVDHGRGEIAIMVVARGPH